MNSIVILVFSTLLASCLSVYAGYNYQQPDAGQLLLAQGYGMAASFVDGGNAVGGYQQPIDQQYALPSADTYHKEFFTFHAPEEDFEDAHVAQKIAAAMQKNLRVVFIKAPENRGIEHAALSLAKQTLNDHTAIFVLNKQHDIGDLAHKLSAVRDQRTHKPEVHFVKYRTPEEALHAQRTIQAQFDSLQGPTTRNTDEGVAPVLNFATPSQPQPQAFYGAPGYGSAVGGSGAVDGGLAAGAGAGFGAALNYGAGANFAGSGYVPPAAAAAANGYGAYYGGYSAGLAGVGNVAAVEETADAGAALTRYSNNVQSYAENAVASINGRLAAGGGFVFPGAAATSKTYLPSQRAKH